MQNNPKPICEKCRKREATVLSSQPLLPFSKWWLLCSSCMLPTKHGFEYDVSIDSIKCDGLTFWCNHISIKNWADVEKFTQTALKAIGNDIAGSRS